MLSWRLSHLPPWADVEAVVFDLDGTVADTMPFLTDLAVKLLGRYELTPTEARRRYLDTVGVDFASQLDELFPGHPANPAVAAEYEAARGHDLDTAFDDHAGFEPGCPKDRQVELLLRRFGLAPEQVLFIGDSPRDARLLRRVGVRFVGIHRLFPREEFHSRGLHSVGDLATLTRRWQADARRRIAIASTAE